MNAVARCGYGFARFLSGNAAVSPRPAHWRTAGPAVVEKLPSVCGAHQILSSADAATLSFRFALAAIIWCHLKRELAAIKA